MKPYEVLEFPKGFLWGAATASHQVEGGNFNNWSEWEKKNAKKLAEEAKKNWSKEQQEMFPEMFEPENYISGRACDHYHRFQEDFDLVKLLNHNVHRFSLEWSRIEPREGQFNQKEIEHYRRVLKALRERRLEPFVTLYHFTSPLWFAQKGGWLNEKAPYYFDRFVKIISENLFEEVNFWNTFNEPTLFASNSYLRGVWTPQKKSFLEFSKAINNLIKAHQMAYRSLHLIDLECQVGVSENCSYFDGGLLKYLARYFVNKRFFNAISAEQDFVALQYYFHNRLKGLKYNQNENKKITDFGWEIYPKGIYYVLKELEGYKKPIYITENGLADVQDKNRKQFIKKHLYWVHKAIKEGVDVRGYFHWSLLDNFEWDKGFWPRFGLIEVNFKTMERKIRPSAKVYAQICQTNTLKL